MTILNIFFARNFEKIDNTFRSYHKKTMSENFRYYHVKKHQKTNGPGFKNVIKLKWNNVRIFFGAKLILCILWHFEPESLFWPFYLNKTRSDIFRWNGGDWRWISQPQSCVPFRKGWSQSRFFWTSSQIYWRSMKNYLRLLKLFICISISLKMEH